MHQEGVRDVVQHLEGQALFFPTKCCMFGLMVPPFCLCFRAPRLGQEGERQLPGHRRVSFPNQLITFNPGSVPLQNPHPAFLSSPIHIKPGPPCSFSTVSPVLLGAQALLRLRRVLVSIKASHQGALSSWLPHVSGPVESLFCVVLTGFG